MEYAVRTSFGDSTESVSGSPDCPFQGVCQGNGVGLAIWLVVSLMVVRFMHEAGKVCHFKSSISGVVTTLMGFMFVDDTDLVILGERCFTGPKRSSTRGGGPCASLAGLSPPRSATIHV